jgi:hypothetical protein
MSGERDRAALAALIAEAFAPPPPRRASAGVRRPGTASGLTAQSVRHVLDTEGSSVADAMARLSDMAAAEGSDSDDAADDSEARTPRSESEDGSSDRDGERRSEAPKRASTAATHQPHPPGHSSGGSPAQPRAQVGTAPSGSQRSAAAAEVPGIKVRAVREAASRGVRTWSCPICYAENTFAVPPNSVGSSLSPVDAFNAQCTTCGCRPLAR